MNEEFILSRYQGFATIHVYHVFVEIIMLGIIGLLSNLFLGAKSLKIAVTSNVSKWNNKTNL